MSCTKLRGHSRWLRWEANFVVLLSVLLAVANTIWGQEDSERPHIRRTGANLAENPTAATAEHWHLLGNASYDATTSRSADGSGSFKLETPYYEDSNNAGIAASEILPIEGGKRYTLGFFAKTANGPTLVGANVGIYDANREFIRNIGGIRSGTTKDGPWEECAVPMFVPDEAEFIQIKITKMANTRPGGQVWVDDIYFGEGVGLEQPPSSKRGFDGMHVRVDQLGNFEIKREGEWTPFFPLCMYSDNYRDWSVYSKQGWNTIIWTGAAHQVRQAKEAVSEFNPDGMMAGFQIAQYIAPGGWAFNDLERLKKEVGEVFDQGLGDRLLLYYWDNENNYDAWEVPVDVMGTIKRIDVDALGQRLHPVYALQGNYGIARVHAARGLVDVSGVYVDGMADPAGGAGTGDLGGLFILDRLEGQTSPAAFAQFNGVDGPGDMRLRLYSSLILGAKAMGYWRDCYQACDEAFMKSVGPVDAKPWWPDFPNLRREVDRLLPIIRQPHWTSWTVEVDPPNTVLIGTRDYNSEGYLILVNQTSRPQTIKLRWHGLPYVAGDVHDYFSGGRIASANAGSSTVTLPAIGVASGTMVLRIVPATSESNTPWTRQ